MPAAKRTAKSKRSVFESGAVATRINARYDVARTTDENSSLWTMTDSLSAAMANNPSVRKAIRERARYEVANNAYAKGIVLSKTNDTIGPEIQLQLGDSEKAQQVERDFAEWAKAVRLFQKLRTMYAARVTDGEIFAMLINNKRIKNEIKLDVRLLECDMIESWTSSITREDEIDGIKFDAEGNATHYRVLKQHPGDFRSIKSISELTPALSLFGLLRKYTVSVLEASQRAAEISAVMQTDLLPDGAAELADPVTVIEAQRNAIISLPEGWKLAQLKAEQPANTYKMFKDEIINEIARCLNMPFNVAAGNSSGYNYASGRLDHQSYDRSIEVDRAEICSDVLDRVFAEWLTEYSTRKSISNSNKEEIASHEWHFAGRGHVDPAKEANADDTRLGNWTLTESGYWAKQGKDAKRERTQRIRELIEGEREWNKAREKAGLEPAPYPPNVNPNQKASEVAKPENGDDEDE